MFKLFRKSVEKVYCITCKYEDNLTCRHVSCFTDSYYRRLGTRFTDCERKNRLNDCEDYKCRHIEEDN